MRKSPSKASSLRCDVVFNKQRSRPNNNNDFREKQRGPAEAGVGDSATFENRVLFETDFSKVNPGIKPDQVVDVKSEEDGMMRSLYLYVTPLATEPTK